MTVGKNFSTNKGGRTMKKMFAFVDISVIMCEISQSEAGARAAEERMGTPL